MGQLNKLGRMTVASAEADYQNVMDLRALTGLSGYRIRKLFDATHGKTLVRNVLASWWPSAATIGRWTVKDARDAELAEELQELTGLSLATIKARLQSEHGAMLLSRAFAKYWPDSSGASDAPEPYSRAAATVPDNDDDDGAQLNDEDDDATIVHAGEFGLQGGAEHRAIQLMLCQIGKIKEYHVRTNYGIGAGVKPDVLWYKLEPEKNGGAALVVEIERGTAAALQKSLASLKHAHDRYPGARLRLIVPKSRISAVEVRLGGMFHEIQNNLKTHSIEECSNIDIYSLAKKLDLLKM